MPRQHLENLITRLHEQFGSEPASPEQRRWLQSLQQHLHAPDEPAPADPSLADTANLLLESLGEEHPQAAAIVREIVDTLGRLGL